MYYSQWLFLIPLAVILLTFHWSHVFGKDWTTFLVQFFGGLMSVMVSGYWITCNLWYQAWWLKSDKPREQTEQLSAERRTLLDMNTGKLVNAFDTPKLKIDHRRHFFFLLSRQIDSGFPVNLTEAYWLKKYIDPRHPELGFRPKRWKGKNKEFQDMMKELDGSVFERVATDRGNATYDVRDPELIRRGAEGRL